MNKPKRYFKHLLFLGAILFINLPLYAQDSAIVNYNLEYPKEIRVGDTIKLVVVLNIQPGFYIYAPTEINSVQGMQVTQLKFMQQHLPPGVQRIGDFQFPKPKQKETYQVFSGKKVKLEQAFATSKDIKPGAIVLKGKLIYQACEEHSCYPPDTNFVEILIKVLE